MNENNICSIEKKCKTYIINIYSNMYYEFRTETTQLLKPSYPSIIGNKYL